MPKIPLNEIYQHRINFIIGSGASSGLFPTLWLEVKDSGQLDKQETIETLATKLNELGEEYNKHYTLLFMYYFKSIIEPVCKFKIHDIKAHNKCTNDNCESCNNYEKKSRVIKNYKDFIELIIKLLKQKRKFERRCNLFTTNYDGCIPLVADELIREGTLEFFLNDGSNGFVDKTLSARNFSNYLCRSGLFGRNSSDIPQINFINLHGSAFWRKSVDKIKVDYKNTKTSVIIPESAVKEIEELRLILNDKSKTTEDILQMNVSLSKTEIDEFWDSYNRLPIVNPTKWKFNETVFEEHYYQMLRLLSYELEEPNSVLITFAFSFADEHILNLIKRSLNNSRLKVFICCFNESEHTKMSCIFRQDANVELIKLEDENLDFTNFNEKVLGTPIFDGIEQ